MYSVKNIIECCRKQDLKINQMEILVRRELFKCIMKFEALNEKNINQIKLK